MAELNPSSDVEGTTMANGSGPSPEVETIAVADYEKKGSVGKNDEAEGVVMTNGSGSTSEDNSAVPEFGENRNEGKSGKEEKDAEEKKHDEENGTAKLEDMEESKEENNTEDISTTEAEDVKVADVEGDKSDKSVVPDSEMNRNEGKGDEEKGGEEGKDAEEKKCSEENGTAKAKDMEKSKEDNKSEDVNTTEAEDVKMANRECDKAVVDAEVVKDKEGGKEEKGAKEEEENGSMEKKVDEGKDASTTTVEDVKMADMECDKAVVTEVVKVEEGGGKEDEGEKEEENDMEEEENGNMEMKEDKNKDASTIIADDTKMADRECDKALVDAEVVKDEEEGKEGEGTKEEENDMEEEDGSMENKVDEVKDTSTTVAEDVKMADAEGDASVPVKEVNMVDADYVKDVEGGKEGEEEGGEEGTKEEASDMEEGENGSMEKEVIEDKEAEELKIKTLRRPKAIRKGVGKKESVTKAKELLSSPISSSLERPVRERKTVERLVEVIERESSRDFQVEKGRGTPLKDIPNVAYKLAKKKPADIKLIHQTLFGRKGKAANFKNHILQFSGFVWHESDEKQRAKIEEKLDKYVKDTLLDLCDLFDLPVSKANTRKEDLVAKILHFLVAPHPTTEVILSEKEKQSTKSRKRQRVVKENVSKSTEDKHANQPRKKRTKSEDILSAVGKRAQEMNSEGDDEDEIENDPSFKGKAVELSESEGKESDSEEAFGEDEHDEEDSGKAKLDKKKASKQKRCVGKEKVGTGSKKGANPTNNRTPTKTSSSKYFKAEDDNDVGEKVFSRKKRIVDSPKKKSIPGSEKKEDSGKKVAKRKAKSEVEHPSEEELRKKICEILKEVDFNKETFTDIVKRLATHYKLDLTPRKASVKLLIKDELTKLAEAEDEDDEDARKEENPQTTGEEVEA